MYNIILKSNPVYNKTYPVVKWILTLFRYFLKRFEDRLQEI